MYRLKLKNRKMKIVQLGAKVGLEFGMGRGNAGDTAVGMACTNVYQNEFSNCEITYMNCRQIFEQKHVDEINSHDILIVGGGGLFLKDTFPNDVSGWQWGISSELLSKIKIPIIVYAIGYNKFRGQDEFSTVFNKSVTVLVEKSIFFSMRNSGSCDSIKKYIPKKLHSKISLNYCPTILFNKKFKKNISRTSSVAFLLGGDRLNHRHKNLGNFIKNIQEFCDYLKKIKIKTILVNHQNDEWISEFIKFDEYKDLYKKPVEEIYNFYSSIDTVISDRGHGQMIPFSCGCKVISPISHEKLSWFLDDLELSNLAIDENNSNLGKLMIEKYNLFSDNDWEKNYQTRIEKIQENYLNNMNIIKSKLNVKKENY
jgi:polysaccharide pyruvyl transferase WcaK-like protein